MASVSSNPLATGPLASRPPGALTLRIEPPSGWFELRFQELWSYRELLFFLVWRDVKARYKQTAIGISWVIVHMNWPR
jgi:lipopolysaccharide transport system permease protein